MSKKLKTALIGAVVAGSVLGVVGICSAVNAENTAKTGSNSSVNTNNLANQSTKLVDENVYVFARTDGTVRKIVSSDWTKTLDVDEYTNFQSDDKKLPIEVKVSYKLNGEEISAKDLAGKSGRVTMRYEFTNKEIVSGYYVPYAVISGLMLNNEHFKNVEVTSGKLINDGTRTIVAGIMMPGMQENLGLDSSVFEIPSYYEVSADATDFELGMTVTVATNEVFKDIDFSAVGSIDQLSAKLGELSSAMEQIVGGSSDLAKGIETLYEKASALPAGVAALSDGAGQIKAGSAELAAGAEKLSAGAETLQSGVEDLYAGINENIVSQNAALQGGASDVFAGMVSSTENILRLSLTKGIINTLAADPNMTAATAMAIASNQTNALLPEGTLTVSNYDAVLTALANNAALASYKATILSTRDALDSVRDDFIAGIAKYTNGVAYINEAKIKNTLLAGITSDNGLVSGTAALATGANALASGTSELSDGLDTLNASAPALVDGIEQLRDGSAKLASGIKQFNTEGIQRLVSVYNNDIKGLINKLQDIANIAKNNSKNVKYIYRTDEIKK